MAAALKSVSDEAPAVLSCSALTVKRPSCGVVLRHSVEQKASVGNGRVASAGMMVSTSHARSSFTVKAVPLLDHAVLRSDQPKPLTRMVICSLTKSSLWASDLIFLSARSSCASFLQKNSEMPFSK